MVCREAAKLWSREADRVVEPGTGESDGTAKQRVWWSREFMRVVELGTGEGGEA